MAKTSINEDIIQGRNPTNLKAHKLPEHVVDWLYRAHDPSHDPELTIEEAFGPAPYWVPKSYVPPATWKEDKRSIEDVWEGDTLFMHGVSQLAPNDRQAVLGDRMRRTRNAYQKWLHKQWTNDGRAITHKDQLRHYLANPFKEPFVREKRQ